MSRNECSTKQSNVLVFSTTTSNSMSNSISNTLNCSSNKRIRIAQDVPGQIIKVKPHSLAFEILGNSDLLGLICIKLTFLEILKFRTI